VEQFIEFFNRIVKEEEGQDMVEYALLLGFIAIAAFAAVQATGTSISAMWTRIQGYIATIAP
jgi:Flp pilus assembly pilin Flp